MICTLLAGATLFALDHMCLSVCVFEFVLVPSSGPQNVGIYVLCWTGELPYERTAFSPSRCLHRECMKKHRNLSDYSTDIIRRHRDEFHAHNYCQTVEIPFHENANHVECV